MLEYMLYSLCYNNNKQGLNPQELELRVRPYKMTVQRKQSDCVFKHSQFIYHSCK